MYLPADTVARFDDVLILIALSLLQNKLCIFFVISSESIIRLCKFDYLRLALLIPVKFDYHCR